MGQRYLAYRQAKLARHEHPLPYVKWLDSVLK